MPATSAITKIIPGSQNSYREPISIAPMLDWSDRHYRYFMRQITRHSTLYSEMIVSEALIHGEREKLLAYTPIEQPLVIQLGGSDPAKLAAAASICAEYGYREINLNCGCPSEKVQAGSFGACLMRQPQLISRCIQAMQQATNLPITIKQRIGLDYNYDYAYLSAFVAHLAANGCTKFIIHARNAVLNGLSPKANRQIPPLRYDYVYQLKQDYPQLEIIINGGICTWEEVEQHLKLVDGVMLGREAYHNPYLLATADQRYYAHLPTSAPSSRKHIANSMLPYLEALLTAGKRLHNATRHMFGLYHGCCGAKHWRHGLTQLAQTNRLDDYIQLSQQMDE